MGNKSARPLGFMKCSNCYGTTYVVRRHMKDNTSTGKLSNIKCKECIGGYTIVKES